MKKQSKFEKDYPLMKKRIEALELDVYKDGVESIEYDVKGEGTD